MNTKIEAARKLALPALYDSNDVVKALNDIFGPLSWSTELREIGGDRLVRLIVRFSNDPWDAVGKEGGSLKEAAELFGITFNGEE